MSESITQVQQPISLRIIFILNAILMILPFVFYYMITSKGIEIGGLDPNWMLYTGIGYILAFPALAYFMNGRNETATRIAIGAIFLMSLPAKAFIGMLVALISTGLTFHPKVKAYFNS